MKILLTGGGTGGHIYPALALMDYIKTVNPTAEFMYVGAKRGLENKILPQMDIPFATLEIQGFKRSLSLDNLKTLRLFGKSYLEAKKIIKKFQPDIVVGTGGYVSGAMVFAASRLKVPTLIHEQNSVPGITNKFLARFVDKIAISFPDVASYFPQNKVVMTGNPRAQQVTQVGKSDVLTTFGLDPQQKTLLIFGGSQGARKINEAMVAALPMWSTSPYQVLYASGERYYEAFAQLTIPANMRVVPYISNMNEVLGNVDLLVGRAGATSIAEFTALGLPAILIPSPYVTNDHQTKNAQSLVKAGAALMIPDNQLTGALLKEQADALLANDDLRQKMAQASKTQGHPDASTKLYAIIQQLTR